MKKKIYKEGDVFLVPLRTSGYGIGMIARMHKHILLGYFWKLKFYEAPVHLNIDNLKKSDAFWIKQFGSRGFDVGTWKVIGHHPLFSRETWEMPRFLREVAPFGKYLVSYNDKLEETEYVAVGDSFYGDYPRDGLSGYGSVEIMLTKYLEEEPYDH